MLQAPSVAPSTGITRYEILFFEIVPAVLQKRRELSAQGVCF
jgi:hypothetical protein